MEYEHPDYGHGVTIPNFDPSRYLVNDWQLVPAQAYNPLLAASQGLSQGLQTGLGAIKGFNEARQNIADTKTSLLASKIGQNYLNQIASGDSSGMAEIAPGGQTTIKPFVNKFLLDTGQAGGIVGGFGQPQVVAQGRSGAPINSATDNQPVTVQPQPAQQQPPQQQPTPQETTGTRVNRELQNGQIINQSPAPAQSPAPQPQSTSAPPPSATSVPANNPQAVTAMVNEAGGPLQASSAPSSGVRSDVPVTPPPAIPPSGQDIFNEYKKNISGYAKGWTAEIDPVSGQRTGRIIVNHDAKSGMPPQPIDPSWAATHLLPQKQANPAVAGVSPPTLQQPVYAPPAYPIQAFPPSAPSDGTPPPNMPIAPMAQGGVPANPQDTTAMINQLGGPLQASATPQAGVRSDVTPAARAANAYRPPATPNTGNPEIQPGSREFWSKSIGTTDPQQFGSIAQDPKNIVQRGQADSQTLTGQTSPWVDVQNPKTGRIYRVWIDPVRDGGRMSDSSKYIPTPTGPFSEIRSYFDGQNVPVENKLSETEALNVRNLIQEYGTGYNMDGMSRDQMEAAWRLASQYKLLRTGGQLPPDMINQMQALRKTITLGHGLQQVMDGLTPQQHDIPAEVASNFAANFGSRVPDWLANGVKSLKGPDVKNPNERLTQARQIYDNLLTSVKDLSKTADYQQRGEGSLPSLVGEFNRSDFPHQLNNFMDNVVTKDAGRFIDLALTNKWALPSDFVSHATTMQFGSNAPGTSSQFPIILKSKEHEQATPDGTWVVDKRGVPWQLNRGKQAAATGTSRTAPAQ